MSRIWIGVVLAAVACAGGEKASAPSRPTVSSVTLSVTTLALRVGDVTTVSATAKDQNGAVLADRATVWSTSDPAVIAVSNGVVTAVAVGTATLTATIELHSAQIAVTVAPPAVSRVLITPAKNYVKVGGAIPLAVALMDAAGNVLSGRSVQWSSSDPSRATVSAAGVVTGIAGGVVTITATSEGVSGTTNVNVTVLPAPVISTISPALLTPGVVATIDGSEFAGAATDDTVSIAGVAATVQSASPTRLTVLVPATLPCRATGPADVVVTTAGGPTTVGHPLQVATQRTLAVGEQLVLADAAMRCNELAPGGSHYFLTFVNTLPVPDARATVELTGRAPLVVAPRIAAALPLPLPSRAASPLFSMLARRDRASFAAASMADRTSRRTALRAHFDRLARDRRLVREFSSQRSRYLRASRVALSVARSAAPVPGGASFSDAPTAIGDSTTLRVTTFSCNNFRSVKAKVVYSGTHTTIFEDVTAPLAGRLADSYQRLGTLFDNRLFDIEKSFGEIGAYDGSLFNPGRVLMLFTPAVNSQGPGLLGFVTGCDFFPASASGFAGSNQTKIFYARVPMRMTPTPSNTGRVDADAVPAWEQLMPATLVHESKHIVSLAERFSRNASDGEESWLEEGTAQIAAELYGRSVWNGVTWKGNATYQQTAYCEVRNFYSNGTFPQCSAYTFNVADNFFALESYEELVETHSFLSPGSVDGTIYGSAWQFVRWLVDEYGGPTESTLLRALVQEPSLAGVANVEQHTGQHFADLLAQYMTALIADDLPDGVIAPDSHLRLRSWNTRDMFAGFSADFTGFAQFPLATHSVLPGNFDVPIAAIAGGSAAYVDLSGSTTARQLLDLSTVPAPPAVHLSILRVQ